MRADRNIKILVQRLINRPFTRYAFLLQSLPESQKIFIDPDDVSVKDMLPTLWFTGQNQGEVLELFAVAFGNRFSPQDELGEFVQLTYAQGGDTLRPAWSRD